MLLVTMTVAPKILYLITKSNFGGAQKYVFELAVAAKSRGLNVIVACGGTGGKRAELGLLAEKLQAEDIRVIPVKHFMRDMSLGNDIAAFFDVLRLIREERPQVLHVTSSKAGGIGVLAGRALRVPKIIFTSHGLTIDEVWRPRWQRALIFIGTYYTLAAANVSIMISKETYERACNIIGRKQKIAYIKNGLAPVDFKTKDLARKELELHIPDDHMLIGGIGELHPNKNWSQAITATAHLPHTVHLAVIGSGEEYDALKYQAKALGIEDRVHLLGYIGDAATYVKAFDIFILPSKKEGLPYVLLEAGLAGLPVVATDLPGNRDIIESGVQGFLIEPEYRILATSIEMLIRDPGMRRTFGAALQEKVMSEFSIDHMVHETFDLYTSSKSPAS
jgi:glycosyltransferase involved in cell wall biosynthesis